MIRPARGQSSGEPQMFGAPGGAPFRPPGPNRSRCPSEPRPGGHPFNQPRTLTGEPDTEETP